MIGSRNLDREAPDLRLPMSVPDFLAPAITSMYDTTAGSDYGGFVDWIHSLAEGGQISSSDAEDVLTRFPNPSPVSAPVWDDEEGTEAYLKDPPDLGPLADIPLRSWVSECEDDLRVGPDRLKPLLGLNEEDVVLDIQENSLRILDGCNDPRPDGDWGDVNRQGLVYGMVQSGKTASMISLVSQAQKAGYRLFVVLAGDKSSLRDQTQDRFSKSFGLDNGVNSTKMIYSPTWSSDFKQTGRGYGENFRDYQRVAGQDWTIVIVIKKNTFHLNHLIEQLRNLDWEMGKRGASMEEALPAMIIDDEADYASQNTEQDIGGDSTIHQDLRTLRSVIPRNCYVAYTATPQACLSADPDDPIGYPRDFWWLLEPFTDELEGYYVPRSYVGAWQVFHEDSDHLLHRMGRDEWPHHEKDARGVSLGVWVPPLDDRTFGHHDTGLFDQEADFLSQVEDGARKSPESLQSALIDYMLTCGIRWWRQWSRKFDDEKPSTDEIQRSYDEHAMMIHMSLIRENQESIRALVARVWPSAVEAFRSFDPEASPDDQPFRNRWRLQGERSKCLRNLDFLPFGEISYFIERCIEITEIPIKNHRMSPYSFYPGKPWIYLLNSTDEGMDLKYSYRDDREIRTKKAAIIVGGNILSRGLTIKGLSVTVFCRTQMDSMGDTNLQMGRWFGHKRSDIDLICIHMQDGSRETFRQIAEADRYLRLQIKIALKEGHSPLRVLVELRNSPYFRSTSKAKSAFLANTRGSGFAGKGATLREPEFDLDKILFNQKRLDRFISRHSSRRVHNRALLVENLDVDDVIRLMSDFRCRPDASAASFKLYTRYLRDWLTEARNGRLPYPPSVNIVVFDPGRRKRAQKYTNYPRSEKQAREEVAARFENITGGVSDDKQYMGDAHADRSREWHRQAEKPTKIRNPGEPILIAFYQLDPNYVRKTIYDWSQRSDQNPNGLRVSADVRLQPEDRAYIHGDGSVICFTAWTPINGPMYDVGINTLIDIEQVDQIGTEQVRRGGEE